MIFKLPAVNSKGHIMTEVGLVSTETALKNAILEALPRTTYIDGIDLLFKVRQIQREKERTMRPTVTRQVGGSAFMSIISAMAEQNAPKDLDYDTIVKFARELVAQKKVSEVIRNGIPTFQRID